MHTFYVQAILTASLGGILYGYDMGVISGALPLLSAYFRLTPQQEELIVSLLYFGGGVGAATGGFLCDWFGRKFAILITDVMFGLGALWLYSAKTVNGVMAGRFVVGWAVAVSGIADVAYLHEISSVWDEKEEEYDGEEDGENDNAMSGNHTCLNAVDTDDAGGQEVKVNEQCQSGGERGSVVSVNEACISLGFLLAYGVAYLIGNPYSKGVNQHSQQLRRLRQVITQQQESQDNISGNHLGEEWRTMFAGGGLLALLQFFGMLFMPESPVWLNQMGRRDEARVVRQKIRGITDVGAFICTENGGRQRQLDRERSAGATSQTGLEMSSASSSLDPSSHSVTSNSVENHEMNAKEIYFFDPSSLLRCVPSLSKSVYAFPSRISKQYNKLLNEVIVPYRRQCIIAFFLATSQQFCGHPSVLNYSPEIFQILRPRAHDHFHDTDGSDSNANSNNVASEFSPIQLTVGIGVLKFMVTCIVILQLEKVGRRALLLAGMVCIAISLSLLCMAFAKGGMMIGVSEEDDEHYGEDLQQHRFLLNRRNDGSTSLLDYLAVFGIYGVAGGYAASYGPLTWLLTSEIFESSIRGRALGFATIVTYIAAGLVSRTFLSIQKAIGPAAPFALYWISTVMSIVFVYFAVPDTGGEKDVDEIANELDQMGLWVFCRTKEVRRRGRLSGSSENLALEALGYGAADTSNDAAGISPAPSLDDGLVEAFHPEPVTSPSKSASPTKATLKPRRSAVVKGDSGRAPITSLV